MIDRMSGRIALLLVSVALLLVLLLGWFVLVAPQRSKASKLDSEVGQTNVQLDAVTSLLQGPIGRESLAALHVSQVAVPDDTKMSQILRQLSAAAATAGIEIDGIAPVAVVPIVGAEEVPMTLNVTGHYFAIQKFLRTLRSEAVIRANKVHATGRLYTVDSVQFTGSAPATPTPGQSGGSAGLVKAALAINAFVYAPTALTPVTTTPTDTTTTAVAPTSP